jgi:hypothetical protein
LWSIREIKISQPAQAFRFSGMSKSSLAVNWLNHELELGYQMADGNGVCLYSGIQHKEF